VSRDELYSLAEVELQRNYSRRWYFDFFKIFIGYIYPKILYSKMTGIYCPVVRII
jgi:hypothetical protein